MDHGLTSLVGLSTEKEKARIDIAACRVTGEIFPHCLLFGIGGTGKTSLARAIACELGYHFIEREAASLKTRSHIVDLLVSSDEEAKAAKRSLALFVDEVHRLPLLLQEAFYYPMKEWRITLKDGVVGFAPFCLIAATTRRDLLDEASFVDRFPNKWEIERYHVLHIEEILANYFRTVGLKYNSEVIACIAKRCLGVPRQAANLGLKIRNQALAHNRTQITKPDVYAVFHREGIDEIGLSQLHIRYMLELYRSKGQPKGLRALSGKLGQHDDVLIGTIEPVLMSLNFIDLNPRGRVLTDTGYKHLAVCHL